MQNPKGVLVIGKDALLGAHYLDFFQELGLLCDGTSRRRGASLELNLENPTLEFLDTHPASFSHALICAAVPNIQSCQKEPIKTFNQNVLGTLCLARQLVERGIQPILFSSDVVYEGIANYYDEQSPLSPLNEYGLQKKYLEELIPKVCGDNYLILRISKVFTVDSNPNTFLHDLAQKIIDKQCMKMATDLKFNPLYIEDLMRATLCLIKAGSKGIYNLAGKDTTSWYEVSCLLAKYLNVSTTNIQPISIEDLSPQTKRAKNLNVLSSRFLNEHSDFQFTSLGDSIIKVADQYTDI